MAASQTEFKVSAASAAPGLITAVVGNIERLTADRGYDRLEVYEAASRVYVKVVIPPRKDATSSRDPILAERNKHIDHRKRTGKRQRRVDTGRQQQARVQKNIREGAEGADGGRSTRRGADRLPNPQPDVRTRQARGGCCTNMSPRPGVCWLTIRPCINAHLG